MSTQPSFRKLEENGVVKRADARKILLEDIHEEPGFNLRDQDAVDEEGKTFEDRIRDLAEYIGAGGIYPPLEVRIRAEGGVYAVDGHRRRLALLLLDSEGRLPRTPKKGDPKTLEAWINIIPFEGNDADRLARVMTSNESQKLSSAERGRGYVRLKAFGWTVAQIAQKLGRSTTHVESLITLATANSDVQQLVREGSVSATVAIASVRKHGEQAGAVLKEAKATNPGGRVTDKQLKPRKLSESLVERLLKLSCAVIEFPDDANQREALKLVIEEIHAWREL